jgi:hypothetical protein
MALTRNAAQRDGWQHQAEHLAFTHTAVGRAAMAAAEEARRQPLLKRLQRHSQTRGAEFKPPRDLELAKELERTRAKLAKRDSACIRAEQRSGLLLERIALLEQQAARETVAPLLLTKHVETLAAQAASEQVLELQAELSSGREKLILQENENHSLATDLNLIISENSRLSESLMEYATAVDKARAQLETIKAALTVSEIERKKLTGAINEANENRKTEIDTLNIGLQAMSSRAVAAEKLLARARQSLLVRIEHNGTLEHKVADATASRDAADKKLDLLQNRLQLQEQKVQELERLRSKLIEGTYTLLTTLNTRDAALVGAEERIKVLLERIAQLEFEMDLIVSPKENDKLDFEMECQHVGTVIERAHEKPCTSSVEPKSEFEDYLTDDSGYSGSLRVCSTQTLLERTISF